MTISNEAVEAAANVLEKRNENDDFDWCLGDARAVLEAAAPIIRAEALNDAADELPYLDRPTNMLVRQQDATAWLRERAKQTAANIHVGSRVRGGDQDA